MKNAVLSGVRQISWIRIALTVVVMIVLICFSSMEKIMQTFPSPALLSPGFHENLLLNALASDTVTSFLPVLAVLPFAGSYVDDVKSKFARFFCIRSSYHTYTFSRIIVCFLSGGFTILLGALISWAVASLVFLPMEKISDVPLESTEKLIQMCELLFLSGGLWAVVGMSMSTLMESKYIAYASPFVVYYMLVILFERYFPNLFIIYPKQWISPSEYWPFGTLGAAVLMIEITLIFGAMFVVKAERRLQQL